MSSNLIPAFSLPKPLRFVRVLFDNSACITNRVVTSDVTQTNIILQAHKSESC